MPRGRTATPRVWPPDRLREASELLRNPLRCNNNPHQDRATADLLDFIAARWCVDAKHYPLRQQLQDMALSIAAAVIPEKVTADAT